MEVGVGEREKMVEGSRSKSKREGERVDDAFLASEGGSQLLRENTRECL